jgi:hypothetical protein
MPAVWQVVGPSINKRQGTREEKDKAAVDYRYISYRKASKSGARIAL